jgi:acyl-CoA synthetase (AMP-forming)/AMP-acid ligase II
MSAPTSGDDLIAESGGTLRFGEQVLRHEEVLAAAAAFAPKLREHEVVAVWATPTLETLAAITAAAMQGVISVPVAPDAGVIELAHMLLDSRASALIGAPSGLDIALPRLKVGIDERRGSVPPIAVNDDVALILYTSGTTGPPKGVPITRRALSSNLDALAECWAWTAEDTVVHALPLFHVHGLVLGVLGVLRRGGSLHHVGALRVEELASAVAAAPSAVMFGVPTHYSRILRERSAARLLGHARLLVSGSAPLPRAVSDGLLDACGQRPLERYGSTEALICTAVRSGGGHRVGYVGPPVPGTELRLVTPAGGESMWDDVDTGEVEVRGPSVFGGYLGDAQATAAVFNDGWYRTGDVGAMSDVAGLRLLGRAGSDVLKCGGYKISAVEIESALLGHPAVLQAAIVGVPDDDLGERPVAFVVGEGVRAQELIDFVARELSVHKRPREVVFMDDLPKNAMGKVQKRLLSPPRDTRS